MTKVQVSVCIPVFNRRDLVGTALNSALAQNVPDYEVIVVDNCSSDGTWEYLQTCSDPHLRIYRNEVNIGLYGNFDRCGELARGEYILFLCSDDQLAPGFVPSALAQMQCRPEAALLSSCGDIRGPEGRVQGRTGCYFPAGLYSGDNAAVAVLWTMLWAGTNPLNYPSGVLFRADALKQELPFRDRFGTPADIDLYLRVLQHGHLIISDEVGCIVRGHAGQYSTRAKQSGAFIGEMLTLVESRRHLLASLKLYECFRNQIAASVLAHRLRGGVMATDPGWPSFSIWRQLIAAAGRLIVKLRWRLGLRPLPYLQRVR